MAYGDRHSERLGGELAARLRAESELNARGLHELETLRRRLEQASRSTGGLESSLKADLQQARGRQEEALRGYQDLEEQAEAEGLRGRELGARQGEQRERLAGLRGANEQLRGELKRLGERTAQRILELESGINQLQRLRRFEEENYAMERDKLASAADFAAEQMRVGFAERRQKTEEQLRSAALARTRLAQDAKLAEEELRAFAASAEGKLANQLSALEHEEQEEHRAELREADRKARTEAERTSALQQQLHALLLRLQESERQGKASIIAKRGEALRL